ncbi:hypothetical protein ABMA28_016513 [Loxostege sticticalis]|uniref:Integrase catalytic domain-containing protein n=1 Tax=Loxostege sticticalis TaxID=481309 RepID=A0ABD0T9P7_LOXSC
MPVTRSHTRETAPTPETETSSGTEYTGATMPDTSATSQESSTPATEPEQQTTSPPAAPTQVQPPTARSRKGAPSVSSRKSKRLLKAKEELLRIQLQLAAAKIAAIEAETDTEDEEDLDTVINDPGITDERTGTWVNDSQIQMLTITEQPHNPEPLPLPLPPIPTQAPAPQVATCPTTGVNETAYTALPAGGRETAYIGAPPAGGRETARSDIAQLAAAITMAARASQPKMNIELPMFAGSHQEWLIFKAAYEESKNGLTSLENLARLRRSLKGRAREAVESLLLYNGNPEDAMKTLEARFGRPDAIAITELERLRTLPKPQDTARDLCIFASRVSNIVAALGAIKMKHYLYNPEITKITLEKLTSTMRYRWYDFAAEQDKEEPDLVKLSRFLNREAERCGPYAQPEQPDHAAQPKRPQRAYNANTPEPEQKTYSCLCCEKTGHAIGNCEEYKKLSVNDRWDFAKEKRLCFRCLRPRTKMHHCRTTKCNINGCPHPHHQLLHHNKSGGQKEEQKSEVVSSTWTPRKPQAYLKILPVTVVGPKRRVDTYALLDDGSTITLIDEDLAQQAGLRGPVEPLRIEAIGERQIETGTSRRVKLTIQGAQKKRHTIQARSIQHLRLSPQTIDERDLAGCRHLENMKTLTYEEAKPRILIGQDNWPLLLAETTRIGDRQQPVASLTKLGWVLHGAQSRTLGQRVNFVNHVTSETEEQERIDEQLKNFFSLESFGVAPKKPQNDPEAQALKILDAETKRLEDGRFQTGLLWKSADIKLPDNRNYALRRLCATEKKIEKNPTLKAKVHEQMAALIEKGYAEVAPEKKNEDRTWYLPCFPVINPMKPDKVRMVHDAAAITGGVSLNDTLLTGPDLLQSLPGVLLRMRQHRVAVSADITEMFLQVKIRPEDRDALRYLWRTDRDAPPTEYRMTSLIFGATSSPATAIYVKDRNAREAAETHPEAAEAIERNHYMDDYIQSFETEEQAVKIAREVRDIHLQAHFELRKWTSNSDTVLQQLDPGTKQENMNLAEDNKTTRVLGLTWKTSSDHLGFNLDLSRLPEDILQKRPTKREALKIVMSLFDPLGLASPVTIRAKQILQEIWRRSTAWDEVLEEDLTLEWNQWTTHLQRLNQVRIPRCYPNYSRSNNIELHVFVDASEAAYAAAVYWRIEDEDGNIHTPLVLAKAKVAPLKVTSIPRLELQAAVMGSRMARAVIEEHDRKPVSRTFWTDSKTVLAWLRTGARSFKPFVAHRIAELEENTKTEEWRWVPTKLNVADDATRDVPKDFNKEHRRFVGPSFLKEDRSTWPEEKKSVPETTGEERTLNIKEKTPAASQVVPDATKFSRWERLVRTTARVLQFISLLKTKKQRTFFSRTKPNKKQDPTWGTQRVDKKTKKILEKVHETDKYMKIPAELIIEAEKILIKASQEDAFEEEIQELKKGLQISHRSRLNKLAIEMNDGLITLKSRIDAATGLPEVERRPPILDGRHHITRLYIAHVHLNGHHQGVEATINQCRQKFHILQLRPTAKRIVKECLHCRIRRAAPSAPPTGNHPPCRLAHHQRPFSYTGVDYFGPLQVTVGRATHKRYVALFTCLTTRAVHLEPAATLTTDSAVMALRRFIARRGCPKEICSDNGTNLHGAERELRQAIDSATEIEASKRRITWRFIPPGAPFMGGAWERLVKTVKTALSTVMNGRTTNDEVLATVLAEVEFTVNSRPLTHVAVDPEEPETLTPNHFLLLEPAHEPAMGQFEDRDLLGKTHWRASQRIADMFWSRWIKEYLPELQGRREPRGRGPELKTGDIVLIADNTLPRNTWPLGRITAVFPGPDGVVRAADVRTRGGILRRPTKKLVNLQIEEKDAAPSTT